MNKFKCSIYRGGTSKAVCFLKKDMPPQEKWQEFLCDCLGGSIRQIDGLGGANSLTSKVGIIDIVDNELHYTFAQVSIDKDIVDFKSNCGNISSCIAPFAIDSGLVDVNDEKMYEKIIIKEESDLANNIVCIRIFNTNTSKYLKSKIKLNKNNKSFDNKGDCVIAGAPNPASEIKLSFVNPEGSLAKGLLPTNQARQNIKTSFKELEISIIDAGAALVFIKASDVLEHPLYNDISDGELAKIEEIRSIASELIGLAKKDEATIKNPSMPKACLVDFSNDYESISKQKISKNDSHISIRMLSMQKPHQAIAITGTVCIAMASKVENSIINEYVKDFDNTLKISHPSGIIECVIDENSVQISRTARCIMQGYVFTRNEY